MFYVTAYPKGEIIDITPSLDLARKICRENMNSEVTNEKDEVFFTNLDDSHYDENQLPFC